MLVRKIKQPLKRVEANYNGFLILFGKESKNSNFHNFLPDLHNNPDKLLNKRHLYYLFEAARNTQKKEAIKQFH
jgi:hypothetical protein